HLGRLLGLPLRRAEHDAERSGRSRRGGHGPRVGQREPRPPRRRRRPRPREAGRGRGGEGDEGKDGGKSRHGTDGHAKGPEVSQRFSTAVTLSSGFRSMSLFSGSIPAFAGALSTTTVHSISARSTLRFSSDSGSPRS